MSPFLYLALATTTTLLPWVSSAAAPRVFGIDFVKTRNAQPTLRRRAGSVTASLTNNDELQYLANISLGTRPQPFVVQIDTGSSDLWVPSVDSDLCNLQDCSETGAFDSESSSTFEDGTDPFEISYGDGSAFKGTLVRDTFTIGQASIKNAEFGLVQESANVPQSSSPSDGFTTNGVWGISFQNEEAAVAEEDGQKYTGIVALMKKSGLISRMAYSIYLNDPDAKTGSILFGGVDSDKFNAPLIGLPIVPQAGEQEVTRMNVEFTSLTLSAGGKISTVENNAVRSAILDSGTTGTILPTELATTFFKFFGAVNDPNVPYPLVACNLRTSDAQFVYQFGGNSGPKISIPVADLIDPPYPGLKFKDGSAACTISGVEGDNVPFLILGDTFMRSAYVVYDLESMQIALAQAKLNVTTSNVQEITGDSIPGVSTLVATIPMPSPTTTASEILGPQETAQPTLNLNFDGQLTENAGKASFTTGAQAASTGKSSGGGNSPKSGSARSIPGVSITYIFCGTVFTLSLAFGGSLLLR